MHFSKVGNGVSRKSGGGGLLSVSGNTINFRNVLITNCSAVNGGAVLILGESDVIVEGDFVLAWCIMWFLDSVGQLQCIQVRFGNRLKSQYLLFLVVELKGDRQ